MEHIDIFCTGCGNLSNHNKLSMIRVLTKIDGFGDAWFEQILCVECRKSDVTFIKKENHCCFCGTKNSNGIFVNDVIFCICKKCGEWNRNNRTAQDLLLKSGIG